VTTKFMLNVDGFLGGVVLSSCVSMYKACECTHDKTYLLCNTDLRSSQPRQHSTWKNPVFPSFINKSIHTIFRPFFVIKKLRGDRGE